MVLPRPAGETERAFVEYFAKRGITLHPVVLQYSGRPADQPELIAKLRRLAPDLIYTWGTPTTLAVAGPTDGDPHRYIRDIPVVFATVADPVAAGLVTTLEHPGRNVTGIDPLPAVAVQLNAINAYRAFHVLGFLYVDKAHAGLTLRQQLRALAGTQHFTLLEAPVPLDAHGEPDAGALPGLMRQLKEGGADFVYIDPDTFFAGESIEERVGRAALEAGLPSFAARASTSRNWGVLLELFSPQINVGRFAAYKAMRILTQQVAPANEPIETLRRFSLLINMPTALRLQAYPPLLLLDAAQVVTGEPAGSAPGDRHNDVGGR